MKAKLLIGAVLLLSLIPPTGATTNPTCNGGVATDCYHLNLNNAIAGVIGGGDIENYVTYPREASETSSVMHVGIAVFVGAAVTSGTVTYTPTSLSGCTAGTTVTKATSTAQSFQAWADLPVTFTDTECTGYVEVIVSGGAVATTIEDLLLPINARTHDAPTNVLDWGCNNSGTTEAGLTPGTPTCAARTMDNQNRLCAASSLGSACTTPLLNQDQTSRLCAASALGTACTTPTINAAVTGSLTLGGTLTTILGGSIAIHGGNATVGNTTFSLQDATFSKWIPISFTLGEIILGVTWGNPFLVVAGIIGFYSEYAHSGLAEAAWLLLTITGIILPSFPTLYGRFVKLVQRGKPGEN